MRAALAGLAAYQRAPRVAATPDRPAISHAGRATLRGFGGEGRPVVFVPSLINPPKVLDLAPGNSLLEWLATQGVRPSLVDWGEPLDEERDLSIAGHIERLLLPMIAALPEPPILVGYCLGGTMAAAAAALVPLRALALIATPWRFAGFPDGARDFLSELWRSTEPLADRLGMLPMEALQSGFWQLDRAKTIAKFERFGRLDPDSDEAKGFVALEDWANGGPPLTYAAAEELLVGCFADDRPGNGLWEVGGKRIDPAALKLPMLDVVSLSDRIVPAPSAANVGEQWLLGQGHVGMIVGRQARATLWEPLRDWLLAQGRA